MMTASQIMSIRAPQFDASPYKGDYITMARKRVAQAWFGANYEQAVAMMAAHMMTVDSDAGQSGSSGAFVTSKREGDLAITYASPNSGGGAGSALGSTNYGREFLELQKQGNFAVSATGGNGGL